MRTLTGGGEHGGFVYESVERHGTLTRMSKDTDDPLFFLFFFLGNGVK